MAFARRGNMYRNPKDTGATHASLPFLSRHRATGSPNSLREPWRTRRMHCQPEPKRVPAIAACGGGQDENVTNRLIYSSEEFAPPPEPGRTRVGQQEFRRARKPQGCCTSKRRRIRFYVDSTRVERVPSRSVSLSLSLSIYIYIYIYVHLSLSIYIYQGLNPDALHFWRQEARQEAARFAARAGAVISALTS